MKNPRRSPDRFRHSRRSRGQQFYLSQAVSQHGFQPQSPLSCEGADSTSSPETAVKCDREIAILLLDAENLKLDINAEKFLASLCSYPLQVKIAFANWKNPSTGKLDTELYDRGYELIHAPGGANTADGKMIAFGAAILYRYRDVRQVFVCSSDGLLNHLCNQLQNQGMTVFRVRSQNAILSVENHLTGESNHYSCKEEVELPTFTELADKIAELLKAEHQSIEDRIAWFSSVTQLFQDRRAIELNSINSTNLGLFSSLQNPINPTEEAAISLPADRNIEYQNLPDNLPANSITIDSIDTVGKILVEMIEAAIFESKEDVISVTRLKKLFFKKYQCHADVIVKHFLAHSSLIKFLQSRPSVFRLTLNGSEHQVAIAQKVD
ncbi:NYN domain-containing protein [Tychonema sp. LEGE 07199]|uniref:NYN domain-containing protein n=1 Tax=unclassified Tychonema TaxID=2642144 RepID=UPI001882FB83|nr:MULTISPECIES: NYN domain-containing protein [unclassified Tychonema]MBE9123772.1 NYN domain-containing protein [Tychonema sp. LEGE 07199]MBE9133308.1 NYN domain-containing protein [Tychonema sp. LEGE 07196]